MKTNKFRTSEKSDTKINRDPKGAVELFKKKGYRLLFSRDTIDDKFNLIFGTCKDGITINLGLYMGYVKYLKIFFKELLNETCRDDQVIANMNCKKFDFIDIDKGNEIFYNVNQLTKNVKQDGYFIGYPGGTNNKTFKDKIKKNLHTSSTLSQFFVLPFFIISLSLSMIFPNYNFLLTLLGFIFLLSTVYFTDTSCMCYNFKNKINKNPIK